MLTMARSGISSYISKTPSYPSSNYGSSYHIGSYASKPTSYSSSYSKPILDYRRPSASTPVRARDSSGYLRSTSNYATSSYQPARSTLTSSTLEPKRYGLSVERD